MAFTVAHMAAALPFFRSHSKNHSLRWLQFDALLIGTMMPDLPYFVGGSGAVSDLSHQWVGVLTYSLPWGLLVFALWYWGLKPATIALIKPFIGWFSVHKHDPYHKKSNRGLYSKQSIMGYGDRYWSAPSVKKRLIHGLNFFLLPVIFALIVGASTHLIWDGITHADDFIARHIDWLQYRLYIYPFKGTTIARLLQYLSSILGLGALLWFAKSRLQVWHFNSRKLAEDTILSITNKPSLTIKSSLLIISTFTILSIALGMILIFKWYPLIITNPYTFAAKISVRLLQFNVILFIIYAMIYNLYSLLRNVSLFYTRS